jgi:hypothetical protein
VSLINNRMTALTPRLPHLPQKAFRATEKVPVLAPSFRRKRTKDLTIDRFQGQNSITCAASILQKGMHRSAITDQATKKQEKDERVRRIETGKKLRERRFETHEYFNQ